MANQDSQDDKKRSPAGTGQPGKPPVTESGPVQSGGDTPPALRGAVGSQDKPAPPGGYGTQGGGYGSQSTYAAHGGYGSQGESSQGGAAFQPGDKPGYDVSTAQTGSGAFTQGGTGRLGHWPQASEGSDEPSKPAKAPKK